MHMDRVSELTARVERNRAYRDERLARTKTWTDRAKDINSAKKFDRLAFWCDLCKKDVIAPARKIMRFPQGQMPIAWHQGRCPQGHMVLRYITDKGADPYYYRSFYMKQERRKLTADLVQPGDPRFRILYPAQYKKMQEDRERAEFKEEYGVELVEDDGDPNLEHHNG